jgi:hypothetical protein
MTPTDCSNWVRVVSPPSSANPSSDLYSCIHEAKSIEKASPAAGSVWKIGPSLVR